MNHLFNSFRCKELELKNRIVMSPMCQYFATDKDGKSNEWHYLHYTSRAIGGAGLIMVEMTSVEPNGRSTDYDLGIWSDDHVPPFTEIVEASHRYEAKIGIQIGHAGRKAEDVAIPVAPSAIPFYMSTKMPRALTTDEVKRLVVDFQHAAKRAVQAGFDTVEIHGAHGYLIHQFHSPLTNQRKDEYGEDLTRFGVEVIQAVKSELPTGMPLLMRVSATEYVEDGYGLEHSIEFCRRYQKAGVDLFDISSGGEGPIRSTSGGFTAGYQVPLAREVKKALDIPVMAVGKLGDPELANSVIVQNDADLVAIGRSMLWNPNWTMDAAVKLEKEQPWYGSVSRYQQFMLPHRSRLKKRNVKC